MHVRRAALADAAGIADVHLQAWYGEYRGVLPEGALDSVDPVQRLPRWPALLEQAAWPRQGTLVAEDGDGSVVGFSNLCPTRDPGRDPAGTGEVTSFYVLPDRWGEGIGRQLMTASVATLAEAGYAAGALWVLDTNARAIGFYEATGWHAGGAIKDDAVAGVQLRNVRYRHDLA